jgi:predicted alpha/beta superfamily hydrolase
MGLMTPFRRTGLFFLCCLLLQVTRGAAEATATAARGLQLERVEVRTLVSTANGVTYKLYVSLPHGYETPGRRYPVVYLLDADYSFLIARNITDHLAERQHLRELILVGVAYDGPNQYRLNRTRDYTPFFSPDGGYGPEYQKASGDGPKFREFFEKELIPFIDATYPTVAGDRCLVGHSYGGLFASWNLLAMPSLFQRYIVVSPSLWYRDGIIFDEQKQQEKKVKSLPVRAYFAVGGLEGNGEHDMVVELVKFTKRLRAHHYQGLVLERETLDNETHNSVFPRALSNGLRYVFEGR